MDHVGPDLSRPSVPEPDAEFDVEAVASVEEDRAVHRGRSARLKDESAHLVEQARAAARRSADLEQEVQELVVAVKQRSSIDRAVGIFMALLSCSSETAFESLRYVSSHTNRKVRDLAELIEVQISTGQGLPEDVSRVLADVLGRHRSG